MATVLSDRVLRAPVGLELKRELLESVEDSHARILGSRGRDSSANAAVEAQLKHSQRAKFTEQKATPAWAYRVAGVTDLLLTGYGQSGRAGRTPEGPKSVNQR